MEKRHRFVFLYRGEEKLNGETRIFLTGYNTDWFGQIHLPPEVRDDYFTSESELREMMAKFDVRYFLHMTSKRDRLSIAREDFPRIIGVYLHSVTSHVESGIPE